MLKIMDNDNKPRACINFLNYPDGKLHSQLEYSYLIMILLLLIAEELLNNITNTNLFGRIYQILTSQILAYKWYPYGHNLSNCQTLFRQFAKH